METKNPFDYQRPDEEMVRDITRVREMCKVLHAVLLSVMPACRERSLAIIKLEEASMWANKGIVFAAPWKNSVMTGLDPMQKEGLDLAPRDEFPTIDLES